MAGDRSGRGRTRPETIQEFMERSRRELGTLGGEAQAAAHRAFDNAIRTGQSLVLKRPSDVMAYGAQLLRGAEPNPATAASQGPPAGMPARPLRTVPTGPANELGGSSGPGDKLWEAALQADTVARSAANTLTFHGADHVAAGMDALLQPGGLGDWRCRYEANLANERLRNNFDAVHRPTARAVGALIGTGLGLEMMGPMEGPLAAAPRLPGTAPLTVRDMAGIAAGGGAAGLGMQWLSDGVDGGRRSSAGDNEGAAAGGALGALAAIPFGPARAGALLGAATSAAQDMFNGRPISAENAGESALLGNLFGGPAGVLGRKVSNELPRQVKGALGEYLGDTRRMVNGYGRRPFRVKQLEKIGDTGRHWEPDDRSGKLRFEDKFGRKPTLTDPQKMARRELGSQFYLNHALPADVGKMAGVPAAAAGPQIADRRRRH